MTAKIIGMMQYLIDNREDEACAAVKRAMQRPLVLPEGANLWSHAEKEHRLAMWFVESLWLEGFRVVRGSDCEDE